MPIRTPKVLIIGAGLAGPALALALKRHGITSVVFELRPKSAARDGGYLALAPNALRALKSIGVYEKISSQGYNFEDVHFLSSRNLGLIGSVKNGSDADYGFRAVRVQRHIIRQTLLQELEDQGIEIRYGARCVDVTEDEDKNPAGEKTGRVTVTFADGQVEHGDFVVGTDGIHSRVRRYIDPEGKSDPIYSGLMGVGGTIPRSSFPASAENMYLPALILGQNNSFAMMPTNPDGSLVGFFATIEEKDRPREEWTALGADRDYLHKILNDRHSKLEEWPEVVVDVCQKAPLSSLMSWPYFQIPSLASYTSPSGQVMVIGDSAHALPPTGGQGAAMAFEDAVTLGDAVALAVSDESGFSGLTSRGRDVMDNWQKLRQERIAKISAFTREGGNMRRTVSSKFVQILREWILWAVFKFRGSGMAMSWIYGFDTNDALEQLKSRAGLSMSKSS